MELFCITIAWIFGIIWGLYFKISIAFFVVPVIFIGIYLSRKKKIKKYFIWFLISLVISNLQITLLEKSFSEKYKNIDENLEIVGTVISNPIDKEYKNQYTLKVEKIDENKKYQNTNLQLNVKKEKENLSYGDKIIVKGNFEEASTARNEGGFNYKQYLKTKKIYGIVTVDKKDVKVVNKNNANIIELLANKVRNSMKGKIEQNLSDATSGLLSGMLIGDKSNLPKEIQEDFRNSSLSHILAISGMHVSYVMLGITFLISKMKFSKKISKIITIVILLFFIILTGKTASVERACFMSVYAILASLLHKRANVLASISISILIILIINPYSILDIGLQLSYGGTLGIVLIYPILKKCKKSKKEKAKENKFQKLIQKIKEKILDIIRITVSANLVIFPIILYQYNTMSFTFIISNLLISSIIGIIIILGFMSVFASYIFMPLAKVMFFLTQILLNILAQTAHLCAKLPFSKVYFPTPKIYVILIYYLFLIYIILAKRNIISVKKISKKIFIIFIIIVIILNLIVKVIPKEFTISFIDVGQGDSMLISTPKGKRILVDGGGTRDSENFDVGRQTLIPYLLNKGITKLDYIVISHFDSDHVGGILSVLEELKAEKVIICKQEENENYKKFKEIVKDKKIKVYVVKKGDNFKIEEDIYLSILWPKEEMIKENAINNNSIVAKLSYKAFSILLTGDIEKIAEEEILKEYKNTNILKANILKVAHHGSKSSSTIEFLEKVSPQIALIGVGAKNTFGHPNQGVLNRLQNLNTKIYRTDQNGEITIKVTQWGRFFLQLFLGTEQKKVNTH
jgi:DNA internalization competence protein ComEC/Rec2-like protein